MPVVNLWHRISRLDLDLNLCAIGVAVRFANFGPSDFADLVDADHRSY